MANNNELLYQAIENLKPSTVQADKLAQLKALEALAKAADDKAFRQAVIDHRNIFQPLGVDFSGSLQIGDDTFIKKAGDTTGTPPVNATLNTIESLQAWAAKKRIEIGLETFKQSDLQSILDIKLPDNKQQLQSKLAQMTAFGVLGTKVQFSDWALGKIQAKASELHTKPIAEEIEKLIGKIKADDDEARKAVTVLNTAADDKSIATVTEKLAAVDAQLRELSDYRKAQKQLLDPPGNKQKKAEIDDQIDAINKQIEATKKGLITVTPNILTVVAHQHALNVVGGLGQIRPQMAPTALSPIVDKAESDHKAFMAAYELVEKYNPTALVGQATIDKQAAEQALLKMQMALHSAVVNEKLQAIQAVNIQNPTQAPTGQFSIFENQARDELSKAEQLFVSLRAARDAIREKWGKLDAAAQAATQQQRKDAEDAFNFAERLMKGERSKVKANIRIQSSGQQYFTDTVVRKGEKAPDASSGALPTPAVKTSFSSSDPVKFKGEYLAKGDTVHSIATFPASSKTPGAKPTTAILVQDYTGAVSDVTTDTLSEGDCARKAIHHAEMLLASYSPKLHGPIIIEGDDVDQANRVFAAILLLKGKQHFEVRSYVPGCDGPKTEGLFDTNAKAAERYIALHLKGLGQGGIKNEREKMGRFVDAAATKRAELAQMKAKGRDADEYAKALKVGGEDSVDTKTGKLTRS